MKYFNYVKVPSTIEEDLNKDKTSWHDGKIVSMNCEKYIEVYIGHKDDKETDENGNEIAITTAFMFTVPIPLTLDSAINCAEMQVYGLNNAMDVASFNASLARKWRENENDPEVKEHDDFIAWVKRELKDAGIYHKK